MIGRIIRWIVRVITTVAIALFVLLVLVVVLHYTFGLRVVLDGGGLPHLRFTPSADAQARAIEAHRQRQRGAEPVAAPPEASITPEPAAPAPRAVAPAPSTDRVDWPGFRGPRRDGIYTSAPTLTQWPADGLRPLWKQPVGGGYASFAIAHGRAFTIEQRGPKEVAAAYDMRTGRELWTNAWDAYFQEFMGGDGPRATPAWADGVVLVLGATGEFRALDDRTGRMLWRTNILDDAGAANVQWGMAASPLVVDDTVVVVPGGSNETGVIAYDRKTGARVWAATSDRAAYAAPMIATLAGVRQIVVFTATRIAGLATQDGRLLWEHAWETQAEINAAQPVQVGPNRLFVGSGYGVGSALFEIARDGDRFTTREVWRNTRMKNRFNSAVVHDGYLYGFDESIFTCVDAATGDPKWKGGRYGYGQVLLVNGQLIVLAEDGRLVLLRAAPDRHDELGSFPAIDGKTWNVPAIANGILLVRNLAEMAAFDLNVR